MSLNFKYIPLTFLKDVNQVKEQIKNTVILRYLFDKYSDFEKLEKLITGTQYGYNASALKSGENKFLRISDITNGMVNWNSVPYCDCNDEETYLLKKDDLLIARTGGTTGKSFLINDPPVSSVFAGYLIRLRANKENSPDFLNIFLNSYVYWSQVVSLNKGEFRPSVNATKLKELIVPKIDIEIQKEAVKISKGISVQGYEELEETIKRTLNTYNKCQELITHCNIQNKSNGLLKQSILQEAIQGNLTIDWREQNPNTESASELLKRIKEEKAQLIKDKKIKKEKALPTITDTEIPFELPKSWVWAKLGDIGKSIIGLVYKPTNVTDNGIPVLRANNIVDYKLVETKLVRVNCEVPENKIAEKGDILICVRSGSKKLIGKSAIIDKEGFSFGAFNTLYKSSFNEYIHLFLMSTVFTNQINDEKSTGINQLTQGVLRNLIIPFPPYDEQKAIIEKAEILMQKCQALEEEIKTSEANAQMLMQAVLKEAFEGKKE